MYYSLEKNVYFVIGAKNSCIYDFNTNKLYNLNKDLSNLLKSLDSGELTVDTVSDEQNEIIQSMIAQSLIIHSQTQGFNKITELINDNLEINFAWIEITTKCNLKCIHCYNESDCHCVLEMSLDDYMTVIDSLINLNVKRIQIIGGEPFFNKSLLKKMLDYTIGKFDFVEIFTNGTLITQEWISYFKLNNIHIALSVYSYDYKIHDKVTKQSGSWKKTNKIIQTLNDNNIPYRVCNVLMNGVDIGQKNTDLYELSNNKDIARMSGRASFSLLTDDLLRKKLITKATFKKALSKAFSQRLISGHNCFNSRIYISAEKIIYPCVMERRINHGYVDSEKGIQLNKDIRNFKKDNIEGCRDCEYRYTCFDCRSDSLSGNITEKPWYCTYNPYDGVWYDVDEYIAELKRRWS